MSAKMVALVFGVVFVIVGLLGFVPNPLVGSGALFDTNTVHDLIHLLIGLVLLGIAVWAPAQSSLWLKIFGVVYLLVAILGFFMGSPILGIIEANTADHWLHVVLGVVLLAAGFWATDGAMPAAPSTPAPAGGTM